ncbi:MAG: Uma2 family endonuclease [Deltaproteobacteria bacterium]|nr:Uma2 family endonuclease [Deltaproteobacteria bacterium]
MSTGARRTATLEEFLALNRDEHPVEFFDGEIVERAAPSPAHGLTHSKAAELLGPFNRRAGGPRGPGGWWIMLEVDVIYPRRNDVFRHDLVGFRRDLHPERPAGTPVTTRPDWACEIISPSTRRADQVRKLRCLHQHEVPFYWLLDPEEETLLVYRHSAEGYVNVLAATAEDVMELPPFLGVEVAVAALFGRDD